MLSCVMQCVTQLYDQCANHSNWCDQYEDCEAIVGIFGGYYEAIVVRLGRLFRPYGMCHTAEIGQRLTLGFHLLNVGNM